MGEDGASADIGPPGRGSPHRVGRTRSEHQTRGGAIEHHGVQAALDPDHEPIAEGEIRLEGTPVSRPGFSVTPEKRRIGMVFQDYSLFPHLTIAGNIGFGLASLPEVLRRLDDWIAEGSLGGPEPYGADFQVAASLRLAMTMDDLRTAIEPRPCGQLALRLMPEYSGQMPPVLPKEWLEPLYREVQTEGNVSL